jgi:peroxiredoxin
MLAAGDALSLDLRFAGSDSLISISSVNKKKIVFLRADELSTKLPVTVRRDVETGLIVLCTEFTCRAVFPMDKQEYLVQDSSEYVNAERVIQSLGCTAVRSKKALLVNCEKTLSLNRVGSAVGDHAPGFQLRAQGDTVTTLDKLRAAGPVVLVFVRSGDWDPLSRMLLTRLEAERSAFEAQTASIVAIHGYTAKDARRWQDSLKVHVLLLSDNDSAVMRGFDVFDRGTLPHPTAFVIDHDGVIRFRQNYENIEGPPDVGTLLDAVKKARN